MHDAHRINAAAHWAALFFGVAGLLAIGNSVLLSSMLSNPRAFFALGVLDLIIAVFLHVFPWAQRGPRALMVVVPITFVVIGLFTMMGAHTPSTYPIFFILIFLWVGLALPPRSALLLALPTVAAYVFPLWLAGYSTLVITSVTVVVPVCVLLGEVIARMLSRLHAVQDVLEQRVTERTAQLQIANTALQDELVERKQLEIQLLQAQKLEGIGRLAGGIAHDFNNMLMAIGGYADLITSELPPGHSSRRDIGEIQRAVTRAAALTRQLLAFARQQTIEPEVINLNNLLDDLNSLLRRIIGEDIACITQLAPQLGWVSADVGQLTQVILNLAVNARDAMPSGGILTIETRDLCSDRAYVCVTVRDTGVGMNATVQARAFEPFFTTKPVGQGTGLGLATSYGIIEQHGGTITISSELGQGTTFTITLPQVAPPAHVLSARVVAPALPNGTETVLVVEDDAAVRSVTVRALRQHGYTVLEARTGADAIHVAAVSRLTTLDLLVADVVMPDLGGQAAAAQLSARYPRLKVLFISGYDDQSSEHQDQSATEHVLLVKPFTAEILLRTVRDVLNHTS